MGTSGSSEAECGQMCPLRAMNCLLNKLNIQTITSNQKTCTKANSNIVEGLLLKPKQQTESLPLTSLDFESEMKRPREEFPDDGGPQL